MRTAVLDVKEGSVLFTLLEKENIEYEIINLDDYDIFPNINKTVVFTCTESKYKEIRNNSELRKEIIGFRLVKEIES